MDSKLQQQLKNDGQSIQQQAQARLNQWDASTAVSQAIAVDQANSQVVKPMWYRLAAAVAFSVMIWTLNFSDFVSDNQPALKPPALNQPIATKGIELKLKQLPLSLEQSINQPLMDEQQAIIQDLKTLRVQLLSI